MQNQEIIINYHGEHHMGAETVEMVLPFELDGCSTFYSTNGIFLKSNNSSYMYLRDAMVVLKIDLVSKASEYFLPPKKRYISAFEEAEGGFKFELYGSYSGSEKLFIPFSEINFKSGLGPVKNGIFPSAYMPHIEQIKSNT